MLDFELLIHPVPESINVFIMDGIVAFSFFETGRAHFNRFLHAIVFGVKKFPCNPVVAIITFIRFIDVEFLHYKSPPRFKKIFECLKSLYHMSNDSSAVFKGAPKNRLTGDTEKRLVPVRRCGRKRHGQKRKAGGE